MKIYGQLEKVTFEVLSSDPAQGVQGRFWFNSTSKKVGMDDGTLVRYLLRNDQNCVFGNSGTAAQNIRFNRAAAGVLQFVTGADTTAEGSLSTAVAQISARIENYTVAGAPAFGNAGRLYFATDALTLFVDTGTAWQAVGSGGGGGSIEWVEGANAPISVVDAANVQVYNFTSGLAQGLYAVLQIPSSFVSGKQIKLKMQYYSPDAAGTALLSTISTLIRKGVDVFSSVANQRTSTNVAIALSGATQNIPQQVVFDLTDSTGKINGVSVSADDYIIVQLTRGTDTGTSDLSALVFTAQPIFF